MTNKHLFSRLHKWGIANDPAVVAERFTEACFVERFGRRRQSQLISLSPLWLFSLFLRAFCAFLWLKNPRNLFTPLETCLLFLMGCNPWLINDLRNYKALYICRDTFTDVMSALQIKLFMQNKAKFRKSQMNVSNYITKDYEKKDTWWSGKKQSQTNPNEPKLKKTKMNVTSILTVGYKNKSPIRAPKKQSQTSKRQKPMQTSLPQRIMKKPPLRAPEKQTQFKPNSNPNKANFKAKIMLPKAWPGVIVEDAGCLKYYIANKL